MAGVGRETPETTTSGSMMRNSGKTIAPSYIKRAALDRSRTILFMAGNTTLHRHILW